MARLNANGAAVGTLADQVAGARSEDQAKINEVRFRFQAVEFDRQGLGRGNDADDRKTSIFQHPKFRRPLGGV